MMRFLPLLFLLSVVSECRRRGRGRPPPPKVTNVAAGGPGGGRILITKRGINYAIPEAIAFANAKVLPKFQGTALAKVNLSPLIGTAEATLKRVSPLEKSGIVVRVVPKDKVNLQITVKQVVVKLQIKAGVAAFFASAMVGAVEVHLIDLKANPQLTIGIDNGRPVPTSLDRLRPRLGIDMKFGGLFGLLHNLEKIPALGAILGQAKRKILGLVLKWPVKKLMEKTVKDLIMTGALRNLMMQFPVQIPLPMPRGFIADYSLTGAPTFDNSHIVVPFTGYIHHMRASGAPPFPTNAFEIKPRENRMIVAGVSDWVPNAMLWSISQSGRVSGLLNPAELGMPQLMEYLKTTCRSICIGKIFPELEKGYPDQYVSLDVVIPYAHPMVSFHKGATALQGTAGVALRVMGQDVGKQIMVTGKGRGKFWLQGKNRLYGVIKVDEVSVEGPGLKSIADVITEQQEVVIAVAQQIVNEKLKAGFPLPIPSFQGYSAKNFNVEIVEGAAMVSFNLFKK